MRRPIIVTSADGTEATYPSIRDALQVLNLFPPTIHRALWHRKPLNKGPYRGWKFRYEDTPDHMIPKEPVVEATDPPAEPSPYDKYPTSRYDALQQGAAFYYTGYPCKRGHVALRKPHGACVECLRLAWAVSGEERRPYFEAYRKRPEVIARAKQYYQDNKVSKVPDIPVEPPVEVAPPPPEPVPNPTYKELMEQARVKPRK